MIPLQKIKQIGITWPGITAKTRQPGSLIVLFGQHSTFSRSRLFALQVRHFRHVTLADSRDSKD
jgi:hypothetical protein